MNLNQLFKNNISSLTLILNTPSTKNLEYRMFRHQTKRVFVVNSCLCLLCYELKNPPAGLCPLAYFKWYDITILGILSLQDKKKTSRYSSIKIVKVQKL